MLFLLAFDTIQNQRFVFSDLMICQAAIRNGGHHLQTFGRKAANRQWVTSLRTNQWTSTTPPYI